MAGKKRGGTAQAVWQLAQPLAASLGLTLWDVALFKGGRRLGAAPVHR